MTFSRRASVRLLASSFLLAGDGIALAKTMDFWNKQQPDEWTKDEIQQLITDSPWAKPVVAETRAYSPQSPISGGGRRGRMSGSSGRNTNPEATAVKFPGYVRWLSAKPMMIAMKLKFPPGFEGHYVIGVSGMPVISGHSEGENGDSYDALKEVTHLEVKGQEPAEPGIIQQDPSDTSTVLFGFLHQFLDLSAAKVAEFKTTNGPFEIKAKFDLKQMKYQDELAV
jgi:hypothetical protein